MQEARREALALNQAALRSPGGLLPQSSSLRKPKLSLNLLNSMRDVIRAATSPNSISERSMAA